MKQITPGLFAMVCYLTLMENGDGLKDKAPEYIQEKHEMLHRGIDAFAFLDIHNMRKVVAWCGKWQIEMPAKAAEHFELEEGAAAELLAKGIVL